MSSSSEPRAESERGRLGIALDLLTVGLVILAAVRLPVIQDEAYYWAWSTRPGLVYFDHPPLIAWVLNLSRTLFGDSAIALRVPSLLSMCGVLWLSVESASMLSAPSPHARTLSRRLLLASPMFLVGLIPATPDGLLALGAAAAAHAVIRATRSNRRADWAAAGLLLTALVGIKHYGALLSMGALTALLLSRDEQRGHRVVYLGIGASVGLLLLSPWLIAELQLGRASSLVFQLERVMNGPSRYAGPVSVPVALGSMLGTLGPIGTVALIGFGLRRLGGPLLAARALYAGALGLIFACFVAVWVGSGEANWPLPALVFAAPVLGLDLVTLKASRLLIAGLIGVQVLILVYLLHMAVPFLPLPLARDPSARGAGFPEIARTVESRARDRGVKVLAARSYQLASLLRYQLRDALPVVELGLDRASQYDRWPPPALCPGDRVLALTRAGQKGALAELRALGPPEKLIRRAPARRGEEPFALGLYEVTGTRWCSTGAAQ